MQHKPMGKKTVSCEKKSKGIAKQTQLVTGQCVVIAGRTVAC
jgi:hypothetical protein